MIGDVEFVNMLPKTRSGKVLRLKGKGFTAKGGTRGDQLVNAAPDILHLLTADGAEILSIS